MDSTQLHEATAFCRCFSDMQTVLKNELSGITPKLFAKGLISDDNQRRVLFGAEPCSERSTRLLMILLDRIRIQPSSFYRIILELDACPAMQLLADRLKEEVKQVKSKTTRLGVFTCGAAAARVRLTKVPPPIIFVS